MMNTKESDIEIPNSVLIEVFKTLASTIDNNKLGTNISNKENDILKALNYNRVSR
jgi:hypothetical protein